MTEQRPEPTQQDIETAARALARIAENWIDRDGEMTLQQSDGTGAVPDLARLLAETKSAQHERTKAAAAQMAEVESSRSAEQGYSGEPRATGMRMLAKAIRALTLADVNRGEK